MGVAQSPESALNRGSYGTPVGPSLQDQEQRGVSLLHVQPSLTSTADHLTRGRFSISISALTGASSDSGSVSNSSDLSPHTSPNSRKGASWSWPLACPPWIAPAPD